MLETGPATSPSYGTTGSRSTKASVFTIRVATAKVTLIQPALARHLPKLKNVALNPLALDMFQRSLEFGKFSSALLQEADEASREVGHQASRMFREEFIPDHRQRHYAERIDGYIQADLEILSSQEINVEDWIFKTLVGSIGKVIWGGSDGPFDDADFLTHLRHFLLNVRALNNPATWLIDRSLLESRRLVRGRLAQSLAFDQSRTEAGREPRENGEEKDDEGLLDRLRTLCRNHGAPPEGWIDYQLLLIAGLGPNIMSAATWLPGGAIDLSEISEACPLLYATWVEVLRFHGTFALGRWVQEDTTLAGTYHLPKGSYALAPLTPHHFDRAVWGDDADEFRPDRFLTKDGKFDQNAKKKLRVFGLFGTVCPGRFLATNMAMTLAIRLFLTMDMIPRAGEGFVLPKERKDTVVGMASPDREIVMNLGGLSVLPVELLHQVLYQSNLQTVSRFSQVNKRASAVVGTLQGIDAVRDILVPRLWVYGNIYSPIHIPTSDVWSYGMIYPMLRRRPCDDLTCADPIDRIWCRRCVEESIERLTMACLDPVLEDAFTVMRAVYHYTVKHTDPMKDGSLQEQLGAIKSLPMRFDEWLVFLAPWGHFNGRLPKRLSRMRAAAERFPGDYPDFPAPEEDSEGELDFLDALTILRSMGKGLARKLERERAHSEVLLPSDQSSGIVS
ncbi:hypothetical protein PG996_007473 [Apiospora saccharicola]|uniref:Cytochrome P450 n=1 Tax=Apiospora saccharicola TaxID=335842 RepID=A0ABR1VDF5_9PEZI